MGQPQRSIFRPDAVRRYLVGKERSVLPRLVTPKTFTWLWVMCVMLIMAALVILSVALPFDLLAGIAL